MFSVFDARKACTSVLTAKNSTPENKSRPSIIRLTALQPPPPMPRTLIVAACSGTKRFAVGHGDRFLRKETRLFGFRRALFAKPRSIAQVVDSVESHPRRRSPTRHTHVRTAAEQSEVEERTYVRTAAEQSEVEERTYVRTAAEQSEVEERTYVRTAAEQSEVEERT